MRTSHGPLYIMGAELGTLSGYLCFSNKPWARSHGPGTMGQEPWGRSHGPGTMDQEPWGRSHGPGAMGQEQEAGHRPRLHMQTHEQESWALKASLAFSLPEGCSALLLLEVLISIQWQDSLK